MMAQEKRVTMILAHDVHEALLKSDLLAKQEPRRGVSRIRITISIRATEPSALISGTSWARPS